MKQENTTTGNEGHALSYFLGSVAIYMALMLILSRHWMTGGEMWAEMATNYFHYAQSPDWREWLFATDAGYIPLPQRLIAISAHKLGLPIAAIPYVYTWASALLSALGISLFCLPSFRTIIRSGLIRFLFCVALAIVFDFETRTFVNFTYLGAVVITFISVRVLMAPQQPVSWGYWLLPLLVISKPAVLAALPFAVLAAWRVPGRYRYITLAMLVAAALQMLQLKFSHAAGVMSTGAPETALSLRLALSVVYSLGYIAQAVVGPLVANWLNGLSKYLLPIMGAVLLAWFVRLIKPSRHPASWLLLGGLSLLFFSILLNCVALGGEWTSKLNMLPAPRVFRRVLVPYWGGMFMLLGVWAISSKQAEMQTFKDRLLQMIKPVAWFCLTGWMAVGLQSIREPFSPTLGNSQWQAHAAAIQAGSQPLCLPIDPFGWGIYGQGCELLNTNHVLDYPIAHETWPAAGAPVELPPEASGAIIHAISLIALPLDASPEITATITGITQDGTPFTFTGHGKLSRHGGMLALGSTSGHPVFSPRSMRLTFSAPVKTLSNKDHAPALMWMGALGKRPSPQQ